MCFEVSRAREKCASVVRVVRFCLQELLLCKSDFLLWWPQYKTSFSSPRFRWCSFDSSVLRNLYSLMRSSSTVMCLTILARHASLWSAGFNPN